MSGPRHPGAVPPGTAPPGPYRPEPVPPSAPQHPGAGPAPTAPRFPDGTPAHGVPRFPDGTPAHGVPRFPDGTPAHGVPRFPDGTPAHGVPRPPDGTPAGGVPQIRGGHPEQHEPGGGWGRPVPGPAGAAGAGPAAPAGAPAAGPGPATPPVPQQRQQPAGPRQDYLDAFDGENSVFAPRPAAAAHPEVSSDGRHGSGAGTDAGRGTGQGADDGAPPDDAGARDAGKGGKGRTFTGIAAAAVTTVLAVVVAGQVTDEHSGAHAQSGSEQARQTRSAPSSPSAAPVLTYAQKMNRTYEMSPTFKGSGTFDTVPGSAKAPGGGHVYRYRVDVEQGLGLDGKLFADAVQKTLNDDRSWAHDGARTFERISTGTPDFVITLASPGTTADWCAKSGLDTTEDNVSCDSAATPRVMINAYRWAQGSTTYGDHIYAYRQMLINHEVGHRLGHNHELCRKDGALAPVMQQQTKFLDHDGIHCLANPWPYPEGTSEG
ncbi:DUF3152 domain-containing protein [Streptomyces thermoviolaceus]|uniref:DUF3152 domain-containing protein n=1 Tax=Streptomyces thermoviolaceus TaxID=1952 RepID=UPI0020420A92|nr:DUF3152 domain-containing protein [Streptomyces thermoviolaceus]MCM3262985.1 DUF3152 domain-containing protein [Streptomyces thermoviolaceus]